MSRRLEQSLSHGCLFGLRLLSACALASSAIAAYSASSSGGSNYKADDGGDGEFNFHATNLVMIISGALTVSLEAVRAVNDIALVSNGERLHSIWCPISQGGPIPNLFVPAVQHHLVRVV